MRTVSGFAVIPDAHWAPDTGAMATLPTDLPFAIPLVGDLGAFSGARAEFTGTWAGDAIDVSHVERVPTTPAPAGMSGYGVRPRPSGVPGPPSALELRLLEDGTITDRCPYHDGTLHVVADDVALAASLLRPLYGEKLRVEQAVFSQEQRRSAETVLRLVESLGVVCATGTAPFNDARPAETVHTLEVRWVDETLADALAPVPDGLIRLRSHVTTTEPH